MLSTRSPREGKVDDITHLMVKPYSVPKMDHLDIQIDTDYNSYCHTDVISLQRQTWTEGAANKRQDLKGNVRIKAKSMASNDRGQPNNSVKAQHF